eukprot:scaffold14.g1188.t1
MASRCHVDPRLRAGAVLVVLAVLAHGEAAQKCNQSLTDFLRGSNTWFTDLGLKIAGVADSLPDPGEFPVTLLIPTNGAWARFAWNNGLLIGTLYGVLNGTDEPLHHWVQDGQILFQGSYDDKIAGVASHFQAREAGAGWVFGGWGGRAVCGSHIYIVDEVLRPGYDLRDINPVNIPDFSSLLPDSCSGDARLPGSGGGDNGAGACDTTFKQAAADQGLSVLSAVLGQQAVASLLPDPAQNLTVFLPTNSAFIHLLSTFHLNVTMGLGDKLGSLVLYHISPGAVHPDALGAASSLDTLLDLRLGSDAYRLAVSSDGGQVVVKGNYPGLQSKVTSNFSFCGVQAYVIDQALVPAASLDALPGLPGANGTNSTDAASSTDAGGGAAAPAAPAGPANLTGVVLGSGYYAGCTVELVAAGANISGTTDAGGQFALPCGGACAALANASVVLPRGGQPDGCRDALTGRPPPYSLGALLIPADLVNASAAGAAGSDAANATAVVAVSPLTALAACAQLPGTDAGAAALGGDLDALNVYVSSQQLLTLMSIGGAALASLGAGATPDAAVQALSQAVWSAAAAGTLNLTTPANVSALLQAGQQALGGRGAGDSAGTTPPLSVSRLPGRRLLRAGAPRRALLQGGDGGDGGDGTNATASDGSGDGANATSAGSNGTSLAGPPTQQEVLDAVAQVATVLCGLQDDAFAARVAGSISSNQQVVEVAARASLIAQANVARGASQLAAGTMWPADFTAQFGQEGLAQLISTATLASSPPRRDVYVYYCKYSGKHALTTDANLSEAPRRATDHALVVDTMKHTVKLHAIDGGTNGGKVEKQYRLSVGGLPFGYRTEPEGRYIYIFDDALTTYSAGGWLLTQPVASPEANDELLELLRSALGVRLGALAITHGDSSRSKLLLVDGMRPEAAFTKLKAARLPVRPRYLFHRGR